MYVCSRTSDPLPPSKGRPPPPPCGWWAVGGPPPLPSDAHAEFFGRLLSYVDLVCYVFSAMLCPPPPLWVVGVGSAIHLQPSDAQTMYRFLCMHSVHRC